MTVPTMTGTGIKRKNAFIDVDTVIESPDGGRFEVSSADSSMSLSDSSPESVAGTGSETPVLPPSQSPSALGSQDQPMSEPGSETPVMPPSAHGITKSLSWFTQVLAQPVQAAPETIPEPCCEPDPTVTGTEPLDIEMECENLIAEHPLPYQEEDAQVPSPMTPLPEGWEYPNDGDADDTDDTFDGDFDFELAFQLAMNVPPMKEELDRINRERETIGPSRN